MSDEEVEDLKKVADLIKQNTEPTSPQGNISLNISNDLLISLDGLLHTFMIDSEMAAVYGSVGADSFIENTGVRLSEMAAYTHVMEGLIEKISQQVK
jgi:hypothetical protein